MKPNILANASRIALLLLVIGLCTPGIALSDPICSITDISEGPPLTVQFTIDGNGQRLSYVVARESENATVDIPDIDPSVTTTVVVTATRIDPLADFYVRLRAIDIIGTLTYCEYSQDAAQDSDPPVCQVVGEDPGPPHTLYVSVQDAISGLAAVSVAAAVNADVSIPDFVSGTTAAVLVSVIKQVETEAWSFTLSLEDMAGNTGTCSHEQAADDLAPPVCQVIEEDGGPPQSVRLSIQDTDSGLAAIDLADSINADVSIPDFSAGTNQVVIVTVSQQNVAADFSLSLECTDEAGNAGTCGYEYVVDDSDPPEFTIRSEDVGPPAVAEIEVKDVGTGLSSLNVVDSQNATVSIPGFPQGIVDPPVVFSITQVDETLGYNVTIEAEDMIGNKATFEYPPEVPDEDPPEFEILSIDAGPPFTLQLGFKDGHSGLGIIETVEAINAVVDIPDFTVGTTGSVAVTVTQIYESGAFGITLKATDTAGNSVQFQYPEALTLGKRPEFDAVGQDSENFFNDFVNGMIVEKGLDLNGSPINAYSAFDDELFTNDSTEPFDDPCFSSSSLSYQSAMVTPWDQAVFEWEITLQMKPASDIAIGVIGCVLSDDGIDLWREAAQAGAYSLSQNPGLIVNVRSANAAISVKAFPGPLAQAGFPEEGFFLDARMQPSLDAYPLSDARFTMQALTTSRLIAALPVTGKTNSGGETMFALNQGDRIRVTISVPPNNTATIRLGQDNVMLNYIGFIGTDFITEN